MINANELRRFNKLCYKDEIVSVSEIRSDHVEIYFGLTSIEMKLIKYTDDDLQFIPLTSKILEKCNVAKSPQNTLVLAVREKGGYFFRYSTSKSGPSGNVIVLKHLHQLQNLYFALYEEELEVMGLTEGN